MGTKKTASKAGSRPVKAKTVGGKAKTEKKQVKAKAKKRKRFGMNRE